jgi:hypothetical protein
MTLMSFVRAGAHRGRGLGRHRRVVDDPQNAVAEIYLIVEEIRG